MIAQPIAYLITQGDSTPENFEKFKHGILAIVGAAVRKGISMVQIREKQISARQLFELTRDCVSIVTGSETKLLVNGRADIAIAAGSNGVHLPEDGVPIAEVRQAFPNPFLIGASVHSMDAARSAKHDGAGFVVFGPVFDSGEKKGKGLIELEAICSEIPNLPIIAVGGIDSTNFYNVLQAGAAGYASIRYLNELCGDVL